MRRSIASLLAVVGLLVVDVPVAHAGSEPAFGRFHALIIGNNDYRALPKLQTAVNDATVMADLLASRYGYKVELLLNADRDQIVKSLNRLRSTLTEVDNLLLYYAGHGLLDEFTERGFWLPVDAEPNNESRWIDVATITSNLRAMVAKHVLVIADSCYSGTLVWSTPAVLRTGAERAGWLKRAAEKRARLALVSGGLEPVADGGGSGQSIFARALGNALRENTEILDGHELFERVRDRVVANAPQTPAYADIRFAGHEGGEFLFVPAGLGAGAKEGPAQAIDQGAFELAFWDAIKGSTNPADYKAYLETYPQGRFAPLARLRAAEPAPHVPRPSAPVVVAVSPTEPPAAVPQPEPEVAVAALPPPIPKPAPPRGPAPVRIEPKPALAPPAPVPAAPEATVQPVPPQPAPQQQAAAVPRFGPGQIADAEAFAKAWPRLRRMIAEEYDGGWRLNDNALQLREIVGYDLRRIDPERIEISLQYAYVDFSRRSTLGRATVVLKNEPPNFPIAAFRSR